MTHYEVLVYDDATRSHGHIAGVAVDQDHAAELADSFKAAGYAHVIIRRMTTDEEI